MDYILINDVSSNTVNVWIDTPPMPPKAVKKTQSISIPGREDVITTNGEYEDIELPIIAYVFEKDYNPSALYEWMENAQTLKTSLSSDYYYKVKKVNGVTPSYSGHGKYRLDLSFICDPYRYSTANSKKESTAKSFTINNAGKAYSKPVYIVHGSGEITLKAIDDANKITVYNVTDKVTIDCERLIAYDSNNNPLITAGLFPFLNAGNNSITVTGNVSKTEYIVNARWL